MKILLFGKNGQVGWELNRTLMTLGVLTPVDYPEIDLADMKSVRNIIREVKPDLIVNAAAYTNVDKAESEPAITNLINGTAPMVMAEEACKLGAALIHYSTDYVYDGTKGAPYLETDTPNPINAYGTSKLHGDQAIEQVGGVYLIFRTSWVYSLRRGGFVTKVLQWAREKETLRVVDDQISSPTWARMLAETTAQVIAQGRSEPVEYIKQKTGLYHLAGKGSCSRYDWAKAILELDPDKDEQTFKQLQPAKSDEFATAAQRPKNTSLDCHKFEIVFSAQIPIWKNPLTTLLQ